MAHSYLEEHGETAALGALAGLRWHRVRYPVERRGLTDDALLAAVDEAVARLGSDPRLRPGASVAVGVGSRGIDRLPLVVRAVVWRLRGMGCRPFVFPAMGSHGGGTPEGRRDVLSSLGVGEDTVGAEIRCGSDVVTVGATDAGSPVVFDAVAAAADAVVVVNRVKPHTHMRPPAGSGLRKMLVVGAGHEVQASRVHREGADRLGPAIDEYCAVLLDRVPVVGGVALLEDGEHRVAQVHGVPAAEILTEEPGLLRRAGLWSPRLPLDRIDLLVVDSIGKDVSGTGMDTNVVGRVRAIGLDRWPTPDVSVVYARALTPATHGNALGVGLADIVHRRLADEIDPVVTGLNALSATCPGMAAMPIVAQTDREAMTWVGSRLLPAGCDPVAVWIPDTLHLDDIVVSGAAIAAIPDARVPEAEGLSVPLQFDEAGDLIPPPPLD